jgi:two-component system, chemotaxis family, sensor kinase CheA
MAQEELLDLFAQDATETVRDLEQALIQLEERPDDSDLINRIFRAAHTIKGNAGIVGLTTLASFTHTMETVLDAVRGGRVPVDEALVSALLASVDVLRGMISNLPADPPAAEVPGLDAALALLESCDGVRTNPPPSEPAPAAVRTRLNRFELLLSFPKDLLQTGHDPLLLIEELAQIGQLERVDLDSSALPPFAELDPTELHLSWRLVLATSQRRSAIEDLLAFVPGGQSIELRSLSGPADTAAPAPEPMPTMPRQEPQAPPSTPAPEPPAPQLEPPPAAGPPTVQEAPAVSRPKEPAAPREAKAESVRVSVQVLDRLMALAGEMVLTRNQLQQSTQQDDSTAIERATQRVDQLTGELQDAIMATRMQSIRVVLDKFKRTVRDLARAQGKRVRLIIDDEGVELDKTVIEAISDPLAHLVRNAVDHGIESPQERGAMGKPPEGILRIRATHRAGQVFVEVTDDGRGIDPDRVLRKAVAQGLVSPTQAAALSPRAVRELVFRPGFSTAESVTQLSGRGVGLDVVHTDLSAIGGTVQLESLPGQGATFRVKLPLTLAILPSLLIEVGAERFAIPQVNLVELLRVRAAEVGQRIERIAGVDVLRQRDALLPLVRLRDLLCMDATWRDPATGQQHDDGRRNIADRRSGEPPVSPAIAERRRRGDRRDSPASAMNIAVVSAGEDAYGLIVDELLDSVEIVVKPLGRHLRGCKAYAGATVLGDGRAALILDVAGMAREAAIAEKAELAARNSQAREDDEEPQEMVELLLLEGGQDEVFGIMPDLVERIEKVGASQLALVAGRQVLRMGTASIPVFTLDQAADTRPLPEREQLYAVLFELGGRRMGLLISEVLDIVTAVADIDQLTHRQPGISGSLVHGDWVVLLADLRELVYAAAPEWQQALAQATPAATDRRRLLVVEDSPFFLNHIAAMLEEAGYEVAKAENGAVGLEILVRNPERFDLVVTDIEMPVMDGFEMVERLRAKPELSTVPVIAVTSLMGPEARQRGTAAGIDEYSIKLDREHVLERCRHLLEHGRPEPVHGRR